MHDLVEHFNEMSKRIKLSREGLDTHNLYLETILKYSYGVIALNRDKIIQLINPVIGKILQIGDEAVFLGQSYDSITKSYKHLKPLFSFVEEKINQGLDEWGGELELMLNEMRDEAADIMIRRLSSQAAAAPNASAPAK